MSSGTVNSGTVIWITGLPSSGKSTLAARLVEELRRLGRAACLLDGDEVRDRLVPKLGYSDADRHAFYQTLANLAGLLACQKLDTVVAATAQRSEFRAYARNRAPRFLEVYVDTPREECAKRDAKGLYAASAAHSVTNLPGFDSEYEAPLAPDVVAHGGYDDEALARICARVVG
ncbi:MAG TPA: adenylyl-sulfate kinase, partial [Polyangiaceae bacterium]|nr:adenylyl-sulfate kinase [Polyangiaceae bacterium]